MSQILHIPASIQAHLAAGDSFDAMMQLSGKAFRNVPGRKTMQVMLGDHSYFIKQHFGVGWAEIFKNLISLKRPILGALTEVSAIQKLAEMGIPTTPLVAYGQRGVNPATLQSFILTEDLGEIISLEDLCAEWKKQAPSAAFKQQLLIALAQLAAKLHGAGLCHRDFYLCHFVIKQADLHKGELKLILIDLHRMLQHQPSHGSAVMKDIAGLFFSAMDCGWTEDDYALFKQHYLPQSPQFWQQVHARAQKLHAKFNSAQFQQRLRAEKSALK